MLPVDKLQRYDNWSFPDRVGSFTSLCADTNTCLVGGVISIGATLAHGCCFETAAQGSFTALDKSWSGVHARASRKTKINKILTQS